MDADPRMNPVCCGAVMLHWDVGDGWTCIVCRRKWSGLEAAQCGSPLSLFNDCVASNVSIWFGWRDRLRILFGRRAVVTVRVQTENVVGRTHMPPAEVRVAHLFGQRSEPMCLSSGAEMRSINGR